VTRVDEAPAETADAMTAGRGGRPSVGVWGTFDVAELRAVLYPRLVEQELRRRLSAVDVVTFAPFGRERPIAFDGGFSAEPLGAPTPDRLVQLSQALDLVVVGGSTIDPAGRAYADLYGIGLDEARDRAAVYFAGDAAKPPVAWHAVELANDLDDAQRGRMRSLLAGSAHVSVGDETSRRRLAEAGVERDIAVLPDPLLLCDRLLSRDTLARRLRYLETIEAFPSGGTPIVVQGDARLVPEAARIAAALRALLGDAPETPVLVVEADPGRGDGAFADALAPHLPPTLFRLPAIATVEDVAAAIAHARAFVGSSAPAQALAYAYGVPAVFLGLVDARLNEHAQRLGWGRTLVSSPDELPQALEHVLAGDGPDAGKATLAGALDESIDELADAAERAAWERMTDTARTLRHGLDEAQQRLDLLRRSHDARGRRLVEERLRFGDVIDRLEQGRRVRELRAELEREQGDRARTVAQHDLAVAELDALRAERARLAEEAAKPGDELNKLRGEHAALYVEVEALRLQAAAATSALEQLLQTKLLRYSAPFRRLYAALRGTRR